ncbi:hypothetical protein XENOCAPTIV_000949 [Xenoophorus captivus]|uniref:eRF1 domain-containing protein n=1 Tax=Xenoophorus captivus TaxID=1517983 RepID=A0ABV0QP60_9TELE
MHYSRRSINRVHVPASEQACDPVQRADVAAVVMQEGLANVVLVTPAMTLLRAKVEVTIPRKRKGSCSQHEKAAGEVKALEDFYKMLQHEPDRAFYGIAHVEKAADALAIDTLMISDKLHQDIQTRSRYVRLVDNVKDNGGNVRIFSSLHVSGEQLIQLSGVAAILRFPIADLSDAEDDSSSAED